MAQSSVEIPPFPVPNITLSDLEAFHQAHFSAASVDHFSEHFLGPAAEAENQAEEDDDGLGYYPDGVKRTLTDEQIAMFRHSEIQALLRERRHAEENELGPAREHSKVSESEQSRLEADRDVPAPEPRQASPAAALRGQNGGPRNVSRQRAEQRKGRGHKQPPKPDLRKRTWDKVDRGLPSLDYGEEEEGPSSLPAASQRRKISYADV